MRTLVVAVLLASSTGAEVVAGADSGVTPWLTMWLLVAVGAIGAVGLLTSPAAFEKTEKLNAGRRGRVEKTSKVDVGRVRPRSKKAVTDSRLAGFRETRVAGLMSAFSL